MVREADGEPIAIFGLSIDKMSDIANVDADTPFVSSFTTAEKTVKAIQEQGINKIIVLSHLGFDVDRQLAETVDGIGLIVGGHTHTLQGDFSALGLAQEVEYGVKINNTHIVQSGMHAQALGHCEVDFAADGTVSAFNGRNELLIGRRLCIDASLQSVHEEDMHTVASGLLAQHPGVVVCKKDPQLHALMHDKYIPQVRTLQREVIGQLQNKRRHIRIPDQAGGSEIAPLVAESFAHMVNKLGYSVDFAIHNAGGVRTSLEPGKLTVADIAGKLLPFAVPIGVYQLKGKDIALVLEGAINNAISNGVVGTGSGSYPYCYNLDFSYHAGEPAGQRIQTLKIYSTDKGWQPIEPEKVYCGSSSAYTMKGKEGYDAMNRMQGKGVVTHHSMADCFIDFVKHQPGRLNQTGSAERLFHNRS
jgi:5'-nucleotidase